MSYVGKQDWILLQKIVKYVNLQFSILVSVNISKIDFNCNIKILAVGVSLNKLVLDAHTVYGN